MDGQQIPASFDPDDIACFYFDAYHFDNESGMLALSYRLDSIPCTEIFTFPDFSPLPAPLLPLLDACARLLHIVCGISYYKAAVPPRIEFTEYALSTQEAEFYTWLYRNGLGEFAYRNELSLTDLTFPSIDKNKPEPQSACSLPSGTVVPIGGGKDSLVTTQLLQQSGMGFQTCVLGTFPVIQRVTDVIGVPSLQIQRQLSPVLFALNKRGAYNGHVPISAIIASALAVASVVYGFDTAVLSNERSADEGNLTVGGVEVNHQFSKSYAFEQMFQKFLREVVGTPFRYFSLLRPLTELAIARLFARTSRFDRVFTSCNRCFTIGPSTSAASLWCGTCPKCASTFLCLAPFMSQERLVSIFGSNLFADPALVSLYSDLCGVSGHKPFECVIEYAEARAALAHAAQHTDWQGTPVIEWFKNQNLPAPPTIETFLAPRGEHSIPETFMGVLHEAL